MSSSIFSNILVAVDGSEESFKAAQYAVDLAKKHNAQQLIILTVNEIPITGSVQPMIFDKQREDIKARLEIFFSRISSHGLDTDVSNIHLRSEIIDSVQSVHTVIVEYAEKENVDLVVIGTKGKTGLKRVFLGSVASGVVTHATCPVLVVK